MDITRFELIEFDTSLLKKMVTNGDIIVTSDEEIVFDINTFSSQIKNKYLFRKQLINDVIKMYQPKFLDLQGKKSKPELNKLLQEYHCNSVSFWRLCIKYYQSGMRDFSLVDERAFGASKGKTYEYKKKPGKKSEYISNKGIIVDDTVKSIFDEGIKEYKSGRQKTLKSAYTYISQLYYTRIEIVNGTQQVVLLPPHERPTWWQFYNYVSKKDMTLSITKRQH